MPTIKNVLVLPAVNNIEQSAEGLDSVNVTTGRFRDIEMILTTSRPQVFFREKLLESFDSVWLSSFWSSRAIAYSLKLYLDSKKVQNSHVEKSTSKLTDQMLFALHGLPAPVTYFHGNDSFEVVFDQVVKHMNFPLVIKDNRGSRGKDSHLINSERELNQLFETLPSYKKFHYQEYIPNDYDWGVMVVDGEVISAEKSYGTDADFRNNACNGAKEVFVPVDEIPQNIKDLAISASDILGLQWSRTDIIIDSRDQKPYILEVNRSPGITKGTTEEAGARAFLKQFLG